MLPQFIFGSATKCYLSSFFTAGRTRFPSVVSPSFFQNYPPYHWLWAYRFIIFSIPTKLPTPLSLSPSYRVRALGGLRYGYGGYRSGCWWRRYSNNDPFQTHQWPPSLTGTKQTSPVVPLSIPAPLTLSLHPFPGSAHDTQILNHTLPNFPSFSMPTKRIHGSLYYCINTFLCHLPLLVWFYRKILSHALWISKLNFGFVLGVLNGSTVDDQIWQVWQNRIIRFPILNCLVMPGSEKNQGHELNSKI
jgi:hypothetical protein